MVTTGPEKEEEAMVARDDKTVRFSEGCVVDVAVIV
jgi:hypothetical protein